MKLEDVLRAVDDQVALNVVKGRRKHKLNAAQIEDTLTRRSP